MPGTGPSTRVSLGANLQEALVRMEDPKIREFTMGSRDGLFSGGLSVGTQGFSAGYLRMKWKVQRPHNTRAMGATSGNTAVPDADTTYRYEDVMYKRAHFNDILTPVAYDEEVEEYINDVGEQDGLDNITQKIVTDNILDYQHMLNILEVVDRRAICGTIVAITNNDGTALASGDPTDVTVVAAGSFGTDPVSGDAFAGRWEAIVYLAVDAITPAFDIGTLWTVADEPDEYLESDAETGKEVGDVRNHYGGAGSDGSACPLCVIGMPEIIQRDANGAILKVPMAIYYTAATRVAVHTQVWDGITLGAIGAGDVLTPWCGNLPATGTAPGQGPNHGLQGYLYWLSRANIATAGGACSTALTDSEGHDIDRSSSGNESFWYPYIWHPSTDFTTLTFSNLKNVTRNLANRHGGLMDTKIMPVCHELLIETLANEIAAGGYRQQDSWDVKTRERWQHYWYDGVILHGPGTRPIPIAQKNWLPPMMMGFIDPTDFALMSPKPGKWRALGTASIWHPRHNSSGNLLLSSQAVFMRGVQMHMYCGWPQGAITHVQPMAAE